MNKTNFDAVNDKTMTSVQIPTDLHRWLKIEGAYRNATITEQLTEAVLLLQAQRNAETAAQVTP